MHHESSKSLVLVGTVHGDPEGAAKLRPILQRERPVAVAVEASPYGLYRRIRHGKAVKALLSKRILRLERLTGRRLRGSPCFMAIREQMRTPFEYRAALRYCASSGASLQVIDSSDLSRTLIEGQWEELISFTNLKRLAEMEETEPSLAPAQYGLARRLIAEVDAVLIDPFISRVAREEEFVKREALLAESLISLFDKTHQGTVLYIGGWEHLLHPTSFNTLCDRVFHLNPRRILLGESWGPPV